MTLEAAMLALLEDRGAATACPSEIARQVGGARWRTLMPEVREAAARLRQRGVVEVFQHGRPADPLAARGPIRLRLATARDIDYRRNPGKYRSGRGEEGVLTVEPYKSELLPLWRFRTPELAKKSAAALYRKFAAYGRAGDFIGMDMARKYLQMGWTRARRYANHPGGRKYGQGREELPRLEDPVKAAAAAIFKGYYDKALENRTFLKLGREHRAVRETAGRGNDRRGPARAAVARKAVPVARTAAPKRAR